MRTRSSSDNGCSGTILGILPMNSGLDSAFGVTKSLHESVLLQVLGYNVIEDIVLLGRIGEPMA